MLTTSMCPSFAQGLLAQILHKCSINFCNGLVFEEQEAGRQEFIFDINFPFKTVFFFFFVTALYEQNYCFVSTSGKLIKSLMSTFSGRCFVNFMCKMK